MADSEDEPEETTSHVGSRAERDGRTDQGSHEADEQPARRQRPCWQLDGARVMVTCDSCPGQGDEAVSARMPRLRTIFLPCSTWNGLEGTASGDATTTTSTTS